MRGDRGVFPWALKGRGRRPFDCLVSVCFFEEKRRNAKRSSRHENKAQLSVGLTVARGGSKKGPSKCVHIISARSWSLSSCRLADYGTAQAATLDVNTESRISGRDAPSGTTFSATRLQDPEDIRVEISLPNTKTIIGLVNYSTLSLSIRSIARGTGKPVALTAEDVKALKELSRGMPPMPNQIGDALGSIISYVSEAPVGVIIQINISPSDDDGKPKAEFDSRAIKSLCTVRRAVGIWDVNQNKFSKATNSRAVL